jgi:hypothetical protein
LKDSARQISNTKFQINKKLENQNKVFDLEEGNGSFCRTSQGFCLKNQKELVLIFTAILKNREGH